LSKRQGLASGADGLLQVKFGVAGHPDVARMIEPPIVENR